MTYLIAIETKTNHNRSTISQLRMNHIFPPGPQEIVRRRQRRLHSVQFRVCYNTNDHAAFFGTYFHVRFFKTGQVQDHLEMEWRTVEWTAK